MDQTLLFLELAKKLGRLEKANDSSRLEGKTLEELLSYISDNVEVASAKSINGVSGDEIIRKLHELEILPNDAETLNGLTFDQIFDSLKKQTECSSSKILNAALNDNVAGWKKIASINETYQNEHGEGAIRRNDVVMVIVGGGHPGGPVPYPVSYLRIGMELRPSVVHVLSGFVNGNFYTRRVSKENGENIREIWFESPTNHQNMTLTLFGETRGCVLSEPDVEIGEKPEGLLSPITLERTVHVSFLEKELAPLKAQIAELKEEIAELKAAAK